MAAQAGKAAIHNKVPTTAIERELAADGAVVVGLDEVGRGSWAGPVSVGAAVIRKGARVSGARDSKLLSESQRTAAFLPMADACETWAVGHVSAAECDKWGMTRALSTAAKRALNQLEVVPDHLLLDGHHDYIAIPGMPTTCVIKGDMSCRVIAVASILAKVTRDSVMRDMAEEFPWYDFSSNKGYPSPSHRRGLAAWGLSSVHRRSWSFADDLMWARLRDDGPQELFPEVGN